MMTALNMAAVLVALTASLIPLAEAAPHENVYVSGHTDLGFADEDGELHYRFGADAVINDSALGGGLPANAYEYDVDDITVYVVQPMARRLIHCFLAR